jgi:hypothetical protein
MKECGIWTENRSMFTPWLFLAALPLAAPVLQDPALEPLLDEGAYGGRAAHRRRLLDLTSTGRVHGSYHLPDPVGDHSEIGAGFLSGRLGDSQRGG